MNVLHLTLKKKWFDMIASGEKKEEYRGIKPFWIKRLLSNIEHLETIDDVKAVGARFKTFEYIHFANGYNRPRKINVECLGIEIKTGKSEWGAEPGKEYFVIKLGDIIR